MPRSMRAKWHELPCKYREFASFRVIMGIMTGLLGCCSSSILRSNADDYVKTLATLGFWLQHSPCSLGCRTNNTLVARSLSPKKPIGFFWDSGHARVVMHAEIANPRLRGKHFQHSRRMRKSQSYLSSKRPIKMYSDMTYAFSKSWCHKAVTAMTSHPKQYELLECRIG